MRQLSTLTAQSKLARHRLQVELWRQRKKRRFDGSVEDIPEKDGVAESEKDNPEKEQ
ncbi:hypothetical protein PQD74_gp038 [Stenotrophomonas phage Siara]|uniref:Uncharacterized protein n=1 Tax=Stenotrophomonas phage Siara TaxID=2859658 RepID=A0AAE7WM69_9CAUD|nr:hypothetical protein PQD74_gp038 [Stenotrophomonas phage Siara]QYW02041.1 hypothetical protein CPT_Siara_038 [Stenotrophomonas phage Siara]